VLFTSGYDHIANTGPGHPDSAERLLRTPYRRQALAAKIRTVLDASARSAVTPGRPPTAARSDRSSMDPEGSPRN